MTSALTPSTIWGIGRNYRDHAIELGNPVPSEPVVFLKPCASICVGNGPLPLPFDWGPIHHEVELAIQVGENFEVVAATIALDLTARELQNQLKKEGLPWTAAKAFKNSCALGPLREVKDSQALSDLEIQLHVNGELRQKGQLTDLLFPPSFLINYLRQRYPIRPGDLILTGTPAGVAPLFPGDQVVAEALNWVRSEWIVESL